MCCGEVRNAEVKTGISRRVMQPFVGLIDPTRGSLRYVYCVASADGLWPEFLRWTQIAPDQQAEVSLASRLRWRAYPDDATSTAGDQPVVAVGREVS